MSNFLKYVQYAIDSPDFDFDDGVTDENIEKVINQLSLNDWSFVLPYYNPSVLTIKYLGEEAEILLRKNPPNKNDLSHYGGNIKLSILFVYYLSKLEGPFGMNDLLSNDVALIIDPEEEKENLIIKINDYLSNV